MLFICTPQQPTCRQQYTAYTDGKITVFLHVLRVYTHIVTPIERSKGISIVYILNLKCGQNLSSRNDVKSNPSDRALILIACI